MEKTFVVIKPDGMQRGLIGKIISRFELKGYKLVAMKLIHVTDEIAKEHYKEHVNKPFFKALKDFITSGPVVAMVWEGKDAVNSIRKMMGKTNPMDADLGTIRGDFGIDIGRNVVHGSDSLNSATREISIFFSEDEILSWDCDIHKWIYEKQLV
ncbi:MAG: nucleoside-diphosphate kinase [Candidatus Melainabacteria bacterium]|nr:nucleoside-diphosphate kinase [Candidatus Melainabacteria bacterium]